MNSPIETIGPGSLTTFAVPTALVSSGAIVRPRMSPPPKPAPNITSPTTAKISMRFKFISPPCVKIR